MSTSGPTDNPSTHFHLPPVGPSDASPLQDDQTANFAAPVLPLQPEPDTDATFASSKRSSDKQLPAGNAVPEKSTRDVSKPKTEEPPPHEAADYPQRYERRGELGRGGWGVVDRVHDRQLEREVAVKRITVPEGVSQEAKERFLHEAKITSQLQHPGVVPVHELVVGSDQQSPYYVMKLLEGETLRDHIRRQHQVGNHQSIDRSLVAPKTCHELLDRISPLLERFIDVCNAVAYAHQRGVIHRDLKPSNIMVGAFGETIVVDWGLALRDQERPSADLSQQTVVGGAATRSNNSSSFGETDGTVIGTPAYMSPEQASGELMTVGQASDIYSLGIVLWEIIVGKHPYRGKKVNEILEDVCQANRPCIKEQQPLIAKQLIPILEKALQADPKDRYESATDLAADVRQYMLGEPISVYRESVLDKVGRWCRRNRSLVTTITLSTITLLFASMVFGYFINLARQAEQAAKIAAHAAHESALGNLIEARDAADTWLIDLSGSLEFYPGLEPIRKQLLDNAIEQYEGIVAKSIDNTEDQRSPVEAQLNALTKLERARCHLRLGDLYFLTGDKDQSRTQFQTAETMLDSLAKAHRSTFSGSLSNEGAIGLAEWIKFEQANAATGKAFQDPALVETSAFDQHRRWFTLVVPNDKELLDSELGCSGATADFRKKCVSAAVRMELIALRCGTNSNTVLTTARLERAARWARWLAKVDARSTTRRLYQTAQQAFANHLTRSKQYELAKPEWNQLVEDLDEWTKGKNPRPDQLQALAHARMMKLNQSATFDASTESGFEAAMQELNLAWSLSDSDSFYRTNLAAAEFGLAQTIVRHESQQLTAARSKKAVALLRSALTTLQELLREETTVDRLRRLAQTHHRLANLLPEADAQINVESADLAYQMLHDHGALEIDDGFDWLELTTKAVASSTDQKRATICNWLRSRTLNSAQSRRVDELQEQ